MTAILYGDALRRPILVKLVKLFIVFFFFYYDANFATRWKKMIKLWLFSDTGTRNAMTICERMSTV